MCIICDHKPTFSRRKAATLIVVAQFLFSIIFTMSFGSGAISKIRILGLGFFDFADFIASLCMCLGTMIFRWGFKRFKDEVNKEATSKIRIYNCMKGYIFYVYPVVLIAVFYSIMRMYF